MMTLSHVGLDIVVVCAVGFMVGVLLGEVRSGRRK